MTLLFYAFVVAAVVAVVWLALRNSGADDAVSSSAREEGDSDLKDEAGRPRNGPQLDTHGKPYADDH
ncbi:MAG: hypothetical protein KDI27_10675 [Gammaproteobacteria bacterium]|nr:hypothetical protein [Gammaproteobacteria bacterium]MCP5416030.1 hypothetical protein [Chromatiaceae bacterium]